MGRSLPFLQSHCKPFSSNEYHLSYSDRGGDDGVLAMGKTNQHCPSFVNPETTLFLRLGQRDSELPLPNWCKGVSGWLASFLLLINLQPLSAITTRAASDKSTISSSLSDTDLNTAASVAAGKSVALVFITGEALSARLHIQVINLIPSQLTLEKPISL